MRHRAFAKPPSPLFDMMCCITYVSSPPPLPQDCMLAFRPVARIESGEVRNPPKVDLSDPKSGLFEPHPLNPPTKTSFWAHFVAQSGPFARFGGHPLHPPWLQAC